MKVTNILSSKLVAAEEEFNSAFGVLKKIETTANAAASAASFEVTKAEKKRKEFEQHRNFMMRKRDFYLGRVKKIAAFLASINE